VLVTSVVFSACGTAAPSPTAAIGSTPTAQAPLPSESPTQPPATAVPPTQPAPTDTPSPATSGTEVKVILADNTINSSLTTFKAGVPYTFVISNHGRHEHNFIISPPVATAGSYTAAFEQALLAVDQTQIPPGSTINVDFTFPATSVGADLEFNCLIRRHYETGMRLAISVTS
jgi:uncharacterized cupredoxin-like copper-binding protein